MSRARSGAASTTPRRRRVTPRQYRAAFVARVRQAQKAARYPIDEMALLLGVTRDTYTKYEGRGASLMPHNLIVPFCLACRVSVEWLLTGIGPDKRYAKVLRDGSAILGPDPHRVTRGLCQIAILRDRSSKKRRCEPTWSGRWEAAGRSSTRAQGGYPATSNWR
jgi:DNA-binding XRE family transcriptional regulator